MNEFYYPREKKLLNFVSIFSFVHDHVSNLSHYVSCGSSPRKMFSQIYLLCGSYNKVKKLRLKFVSLLEASVGQHDFMERVSQFYLFVEESVILTHIYFTFFYN